MVHVRKKFRSPFFDDWSSKRWKSSEFAKRIFTTMEIIIDESHDGDTILLLSMALTQCVS